MTEVSNSEAVISPTNGDDESARKEALRKAGAEYFDKVLSKARCRSMSDSAWISYCADVGLFLLCVDSPIHVGQPPMKDLWSDVAVLGRIPSSILPNRDANPETLKL